MRLLSLAMGLILATPFYAGCRMPSGSTSASLGGVYISPDEAGPISMTLNNSEMNTIATEISDAMKRKGLPKGFVVGMGPVDTSGSTQPIPQENLAEAIRVRLEEEGSLRFTEVVEADRSKVGEILKVKDLNWEIANPDDAEAKYKVGRIANVDGLLIGRVSSEETLTPDGRARQIVYRFFWRLVDANSYLSLMSYQHQLAKSLPIARR